MNITPRNKAFWRFRASAAALIGGVLTLWAASALYFDSPFATLRKPFAAVYFLAIASTLVFYRRFAFMIASAAFMVVLIWWLSLKPSNRRNWQADVAQTPWAEVDGDRVTIHNVRHCDYRAEFDYTCEWQTRTLDLSRLRGLDMALTYWGSPWIAHTMTIFDFGDEGHLPISIETRKAVGQSYSAVLGFFRQYELIYVVSDERDLIRLRTNFRTAEEVYLFHTAASPQQARGLFLQYVDHINRLHSAPEWYNALTNNCTTNIAVSAAASGVHEPRWDWRILLSGKSDEMMYDDHQLVTDGLSFPDLKARAHINAAARAANQDPDFSKRIRENRPGFGG